MYTNHLTHYLEISKYQMHMRNTDHLPPFPPSRPFNNFKTYIYTFLGHIQRIPTVTLFDK
jgi:hypothetical protein